MRGQKGITLVALVITIIVMLILVGVSVTVAINGGLFTKAREGATNTQKEANAERNLSSGIVKVDGYKEADINAIVDGTATKE